MARFRKIFPIILMIWPYVFFVHEYFEYKNAHNFFTLYVILTIVVYVLNIVNALTYPKDKVNDLAFYDMLIKFVHIPFFLLIFGIGLLLLFAMVVPALIFFSPLMIMILAIIDYLLMITSSMYGISAVVKLEQSGRLEKGKGLIYLVLHLAFVVDFLSAVSLYRRVRRN